MPFFTSLKEDPFSWTTHATIAKRSAAFSTFSSWGEYKRNLQSLSIPNDAIFRIADSLYGGNTNYYFGDYLFTEVDLNQMKHSPDGYYVTDKSVPIHASESVLLPPSFHPIEKPRVIARMEDSAAPARRSVTFDCFQCHLHFPSERQLKRHMRVHKSEEESSSAPSTSSSSAPFSYTPSTGSSASSLPSTTIPSSPSLSITVSRANPPASQSEASHHTRPFSRRRMRR